MEDLIIVIVLAAIVSGIAIYLIRAKRRGKRCIGCPYADECDDSCSCTHKKRGNENGEQKTD